MTSKFQEMIDEMTASLPEEITTLDQIKALPWGGNAAWDVPIMMHIDRTFTANETLPRSLRMEGAALAGHLMTGEDCSFKDEEEFDVYLRDLREGADRD